MSSFSNGTDRAERVRRALLFVPGDDLKKINKAAGLGTDSLILDMEDGAALNRKTEARTTIAQALRTIDFGRSERLARINPLESGWGLDDLNTVLPARPDGIVVPKVETEEQVQEVSLFITQFEKREGLPAGGIRLLIFVETAKGVINLRQIAGSDPRLDGIMFGGEDLVGSLGAVRTKPGWEIFYARSALVTYAAAFGLQAIDTIYADLHDIPGLVEDSRLAQQMGYTGKLAIHPRQVEPITEVFTPSDEAVAAARRLSEAFQTHQSSGAGVFELDGKMVDMPMLRAAERVLSRARAAGKV